MTSAYSKKKLYILKIMQIKMKAKLFSNLFKIDCLCHRISNFRTHSQIVSLNAE